MDFSVVIAAIAAFFGSGSGTSQALPVSVTYKSTTSYATRAKYQVVTSQAQWKKAWIEESRGTRSTPAIDFKSKFVLLIQQGKTVGSSGIVFHSVQRVNEQILVRFDNDSAPASKRNTVTASSGYAVIPNTRGTYVFLENVQQVKDKPPIWRERARQTVK